MQEYWTRSLRFLTTEVANQVYGAHAEEIALAANGLLPDELQVEDVAVQVLPQPQEPHGASARFNLVRLRGGQEVERESWSVALQFRFLPEIPAELVVWNPTGLVISFLPGNPVQRSSRGWVAAQARLSRTRKAF